MSDHAGERIPPGEAITTGDLARICRVAPRTAANWIDRGQLKGHRVPGTLHRRTTRAAVEKFLADNGMPAHWLTDWLRVNAPAPVATTAEAPHAG